LNLDRIVAGMGALALFVGAYIAEIIRAGIQSIAKGQTEAARSLGMSATDHDSTSCCRKPSNGCCRRWPDSSSA
jgi:hypothetical protein